MSESLVGLGHLVGILALLNSTAQIVASVQDLACQTLTHGLFRTSAGVLGDPTQAQGLTTLRANFHRHLVGSAAYTASLNFQGRHDVFHSLGENLQRFTTGLFTNDIDTMADALNNSFAMVIQSFIQIVGTLTLLYILNWRLSLIVTVCYGIMFWYIKFSGKRSKGYYTKQQNSLGELNGYIEELITGQKVVKVFHHEEESFTEFCKKNEELRKAGTGAQGYAATMVPVVVSISYVNYAIVAVLGGLLALHGKADIGSLASYLVFVRQAALPINQFTQQSNFLLSALAGAERVFDVMSLEPEIDEGKVELVNVKEENGALAVCEETTGRWAWKRPDGTMTELKGDVRFENVDFGYTADRLILKNISLYAKPGQKIAFVGSTGAGKTTITNLINRFYDVQGGAVVYDGIDVKDIEKDALRHSLGIVLQDTHLFTGTVAENIRFGKLDATQEEIEHAAKIANADSFIRRLPNGYDTMLTSDGANLSQGQRQLLAIARAAVADPPVLILDEATSSVDTRTEALIRKRNGPAHGGQNRICHRPPLKHRAKRQCDHGAGAGKYRRARRPRRTSGTERKILSALSWNV